MENFSNIKVKILQVFKKKTNDRICGMRKRDDFYKIKIDGFGYPYLIEVAYHTLKEFYDIIYKNYPTFYIEKRKKNLVINKHAKNMEIFESMLKSMMIDCKDLVEEERLDIQ